MAEITLATLTQAHLDRLVRQLEDSALEIATLTAERDSARQQSTANAPTPTNARAQSEEPIVSVGQRSGVASDGATHSMPGMERNRVAPSPREPREARRNVEFAATSGNHDIMAPMPLKPQRPPCFDPSQHRGPTVQSWSPESSTVHVNAITMKRVVAAGGDVYAEDIAVVEEAEQPSDFQKVLAAVPPELQELLKLYPGIFPDDLPEGLPP
ncbi:unnamed protein product [Closterium sp. NIES-54]